MSNVVTIKEFIVDEFLPGGSTADLDADYDLLNNGVVDSLGVLKLIAWIEDRFGIEITDELLDPDNFRSVSCIDAFVSSTTAPVG